MRWLLDEIKALQGGGLFRSLKRIDSKEVINFCSNDYLGLSQDLRVIRGAVEAAQRYGAGNGSARLISGNCPLHEELEAALAAFKGAGAALLFNSGYHANIGVIPALAGEGDLIFSDELNHASIIDGCRLSKAQTVIYRHKDVGHLEDLLKKNPLPSRERVAEGRVRVIITESVFSMEGDLAPLEDLKSLAKKQGALLYVDEAHAVGVFGERGEGRVGRNPPEYLVTMGTLGKAFGSYGAFVTGSQALKDYLINKARSFIFTTALPPATVGASLVALTLIQSEPERRQRLWENIRWIQKILLTDQGYSPIFSIGSMRVGSAEKVMALSQQLLEEGIYLQGIRPPTVPEGTSRLRLTASALHTEVHLEKLAEKLKKHAINFEKGR